MQHGLPLPVIEFRPWGKCDEDKKQVESIKCKAEHALNRRHVRQSVIARRSADRWSMLDDNTTALHVSAQWRFAVGEF